MSSYTVGVDVGTGSVRAALCDDRGNIVSVSNRELNINSPHTDYYEQSSQQIWEACVHCIMLGNKHYINQLSESRYSILPQSLIFPFFFSWQNGKKPEKSGKNDKKLAIFHFL